MKTKSYIVRFYDGTYRYVGPLHRTWYPNKTHILDTGLTRALFRPIPRGEYGLMF
jgi:hypothetical protein